MKITFLLCNKLNWTVRLKWGVFCLIFSSEKRKIILKSSVYKGPFQTDESANPHCVMVIFAVFMRPNLKDTHAAQQVYVRRSRFLTLDKTAATAINHQLNQEQEKTMPLTTLSQHLFTSHWFDESHHSAVSVTWSSALWRRDGQNKGSHARVVSVINF